MRYLFFFIALHALSLYPFAFGDHSYASLSSDAKGVKLLLSKGYDVVRESMISSEGVYTFEVYATVEQLGQLKEMGFEPVVLQDSRSKEEKQKGYRTNDRIGFEFDSLQTAYPSIVKRIQVGTSVQGRPIWAVKISDNVNDDEAEPEFKYTSTMHGDEVVGMELCMELVYDIIEGYYAGNDTMKYAVEETELFIMPLHNPDGMANVSRYNANGYDLNRSFPERIYGHENTAVGKQPEVAAFINWNNDRHFVLSANFHGGAVVVNYPWDADPVLSSGQYAASPDDAHFIFISRGYADRNPRMTGFDNGITNGLEWYEALGGMQDWNYHYYGDMEVTVELTSTKWPSYSTIPGHWADNRSAMLWYLMAVHKGIKGKVTSSAAGIPLNARITVEGIDKDFFSRGATGEFYKILKPGNYTITAEADGFVPKTISGVEVKDSLASVVNFALDSCVGIEEHANSIPSGIMLEQNYPNPFNPVTNIAFTLDKDTELSLAVYDGSGRQIKVLARGLYSKGRHSVEFKADGINSGSYYYSLRDGQGKEVSKKMLIIK
jgi:hypothetical protein